MNLTEVREKALEMSMKIHDTLADAIDAEPLDDVAKVLTYELAVTYLYMNNMLAKTMEQPKEDRREFLMKLHRIVETDILKRVP